MIPDNIKLPPANKMTPPLTSTCKCYFPPIYYGDYHISFLGIDKTNGRFAEVTIETCVHCGTKWIKYSIEFEAFSNSGRWYRGMIADEAVNEMVPEKAVMYLEKKEFYIFGGSYFESAGMYGNGTLQVDL